jgi:hypothetical protein
MQCVYGYCNKSRLFIYVFILESPYNHTSLQFNIFINFSVVVCVFVAARMCLRAVV